MLDNHTLPELSPAKAALAAAIARADQAARRLDAAHRPLAGLEADKTTAHREVMELRVAIAAVRAPANPAFARPAASLDLTAAERQLAALTAAAAAAETQCTHAQQAYAETVQAARAATFLRDNAVWPAVTEAAQPALDRLRARIAAVLETEAELRALMTALFEAGNRDEANNGAARLAAEQLDHAIRTARQAPAAPIDLAPARALIGRLRTDPAVSL